MVLKFHPNRIGSITDKAGQSKINVQLNCENHYPISFNQFVHTEGHFTLTNDALFQLIG